jgi:3-hydroxybutyrate dehydrogenase
MAKTILITGSTSGIGLVTAKTFAANGYQIIFNGLEENGEEIAIGVARDYAIEYFFSPANLLNPEEIRKMVEQGLSKFGAIDVLLNNAGIQHVAPLENFPEQKWNDLLGVMLTAPFHVTKAVWPSMKERKYGRVINLVSAHGLVASAFKSAYVAAKHGLIGLTKTLALEGAPFGITANAVCPGYVHTSLVEKQIPDQMKAHNLSREEEIQKVILAQHAIKQFIPAEVIAETIYFLADSEASAFITGASIPVDAGWTAH